MLRIDLRYNFIKLSFWNSLHKVNRTPYNTLHRHTLYFICPGREREQKKIVKLVLVNFSTAHLQRSSKVESTHCVLKTIDSLYYIFECIYSISLQGPAISRKRYIFQVKPRVCIMRVHKSMCLHIFNIPAPLHYITYTYIIWIEMFLKLF